MSSPESTDTVEATTVPEAPVRRSRTPARLALAAAAVGALLFVTACTPQEQARRAVEPHWGHNTPCALRVVNKESGYRADAVSPGGGNIGLFQINRVHTQWVQQNFGYSWEELKDPHKNARVAKALSEDSYHRTGDGWAPWRFSGANRTGCPA